jgi:hypothetical protein
VTTRYTASRRRVSGLGAAAVFAGIGAGILAGIFAGIDAAVFVVVVSVGAGSM